MTEYPQDKSKNLIFKELRSGIVRGLYVVGFFSCIINVLMLTTPIYMLQMFDRVLSSRNIDTLILLTVIAGGALLTLAVLLIIRSSVLIRVGTWLDQRIRARVLATTISSATKNGRRPSSRVLGDLNAIRRFFTRTAIIPMFNAPWSPIFLLIIFFLSPILGGVALTGLLIMLFLALGHDRIITFLSSKAGSTSRPANDRAKALLRNADAAVSMGMVSTLVYAWDKQNSDVLDLQAREEHARATYGALTKSLTMGLRIAMLATGAVLVIQNSITTGVMLAAVILGARAIAPMTGIIKAWRSIVEAKNAYGRLKSDHESTTEKEFGEHFYAPIGDLSVRRVGFRYHNSPSRVSRQITLDLQPGEALSVVGPPGSGKSTFGKLVLGILQPRSGHILFCGSAIDGLAPSVRAAHVGYLPPEPQLFDGTIYENISRMNFGMQQAVIEAAHLAGIHDIIVSLPEGYDTQISSDDLKLSAGEAQLISLARAIFGQPKLVVLDEPCSHLDRSSENTLVHVIQTLKERGAIVVVISHRTKIQACCDRVLTMPDGKVGTPGLREKLNLKMVEDNRRFQITKNTSGKDG